MMRQESTLLTRFVSSLFAAFGVGFTVLVLLAALRPQTDMRLAMAAALPISMVVLNVLVKLDGIWRAVENLKGDVK